MMSPVSGDVFSYKFSMDFSEPGKDIAIALRLDRGTALPQPNGQGASIPHTKKDGLMSQFCTPARICKVAGQL
jgi:hypothetical protein